MSFFNQYNLKFQKQEHHIKEKYKMSHLGLNYNFWKLSFINTLFLARGYNND